MNVVILAGGLGSRLAEETEIKPKPMVEIGGRPILWHIMKHYAHYGFKDFCIAAGYKGQVIKRFFLDYYSSNGDITINLSNGGLHVDNRQREDWKIHIVDTGMQTHTGGRLLRLQPWLKDETFMLTYGDGVCDIDLQDLLRFHRSRGRLATVTAVRPPARFGGLVFDGDVVTCFTEKPQIGEGWINGGFMVFEPGIFRYLDGDESWLEGDAMERLARDGQLVAYRHEGFWQCMDTLRDVRLLERLDQTRQAPWQVWAKEAAWRG
jgi:glucose-1-phosphate cytidylyltransferase